MQEALRKALAGTASQPRDQFKSLEEWESQTNALSQVLTTILITVLERHLDQTVKESEHLQILLKRKTVEEVVAQGQDAQPDSEAASSQVHVNQDH